MAGVKYGVFQLTQGRTMQQKSNETHYVLTNCDNSTTETDDIEDAKLALCEGQEVIKNTRITLLFRAVAYPAVRFDAD